MINIAPLKPYIIPIFIPNLGCSHRCIYCHQSNITGKKPHLDLKEIKKDIDFFLSRKRHKKRGDVQIAFYGGTFTALNTNLRKTLLQLTSPYIQSDQVQSLRLSTRPDAIDVNVLTELKNYGVKTIELGVQSLDDRVLALVKRGHDSKAIYWATKLIKSFGFELGWQLMLGLPGETGKSWQKTISGVIKWRPDFIRIYPTLVIKDTVLAYWWKQGKYRALSLEEAIERCKKMVFFLEKTNVTIIRLGLQVTKSLTQTGHIISGPWHPAFGELVKSAIILEKLKKILKDHFLREKEINIFVHPSKLSQSIGQKRLNFKRLKTIFPKKKIAIYPLFELKRKEIKIISHQKEEKFYG
jgi:histone acetyltransferase (RNA polymerase elongator complex component)